MQLPESRANVNATVERFRALSQVEHCAVHLSLEIHDMHGAREYNSMARDPAAELCMQQLHKPCIYGSKGVPSAHHVHDIHVYLRQCGNSLHRVSCRSTSMSQRDGVVKLHCQRRSDVGNVKNVSRRGKPKQAHKKTSTHQHSPQQSRKTAHSTQ